MAYLGTPGIVYQAPSIDLQPDIFNPSGLAPFVIPAGILNPTTVTAPAIGMATMPAVVAKSNTPMLLALAAGAFFLLRK